MSVFDIFNPIGDVATSIVDRVPGHAALGKAMADAYKSGQTWLNNASKVPGLGILVDAVSNAIVDNNVEWLIPIVGPASIALIGLPNIVVHKDDVTDAYIKAVVLRLEELVTMGLAMATGPVVPNLDSASAEAKKQATDAAYAWVSQLQQVSNDPEVQQAIGSVARGLAEDAIRDALVKAHLTPEEIAARFNVRPDVAAMAINYILRKNVYDPHEFGIVDGKRPIPVVDPTVGPLKSSSEYLMLWNVQRAILVSLQQAANAGIPGVGQKLASVQDQVQKLQILYETALSQENPPRDTTFWTAALAQAKASGAPPTTIANIQRNLDASVAKQNQLLNGSGLSFDIRGTPVGFGKPDAGTVLLDLAVVGAALYALFRFGRR